MLYIFYIERYVINNIVIFFIFVKYIYEMFVKYIKRYIFVFYINKSKNKRDTAFY